MSLKARLRLAVALLMSLMVVTLSGLYIRSFLSSAFARAHDIADSIANQLQATMLDTLQRRAKEAERPPVTAADAREFWLRTVDEDPVIAAILERPARYWRLVVEIFITDENGRIHASTAPNRTGRHEGVSKNLAEWRSRSVWTNLEQVYLDNQDSEIRRPVGIVGEQKPIFNIHVVVNPAFLRSELAPGLHAVWAVCIACLVVSIVLAILLPTFLLSPLERLGHSLDRLAVGEFSTEPTPRKEAKEFAAVYSKLDLLGQRYQGAQDNVDHLRGNVEHLLQRLEEAVLLFDAGGKLTMAGSAVRRLLNCDPVELSGRTIDEVFASAQDIGSLIRTTIDEARPVHDYATRLDNGSQEFDLLISTQPLVNRQTGRSMGALVTLRDAGTRDELEAQLDLAERLSAISRLTRGVAHEIKNPLNAIRLHLEVLRTRYAATEPEFDVISREISRLDRVVKTFLDFNRPVTPQMRPMDLNEVARDLAKLVGLDAQTRDVRIQVETGASPTMVNGDRDLLKQAFLNVIVNAVEAMTTGGDVTIETRKNGNRCEFLVHDNGPGIPPDVQDKIFNLYFSTKAKGSGIGLAMAFRLVQLHDGKIEFSSNVGSGTTFRFNFPQGVFPSEADVQLSRGHRA